MSSRYPGYYDKEGPPTTDRRGEVIRPLWPEADIAVRYGGRRYEDVVFRKLVQQAEKL